MRTMRHCTCGSRCGRAGSGIHAATCAVQKSYEDDMPVHGPVARSLDPLQAEIGAESREIELLNKRGGPIYNSVIFTQV